MSHVPHGAFWGRARVSVRAGVQACGDTHPPQAAGPTGRPSAERKLRLAGGGPLPRPEGPGRSCPGTSQGPELGRVLAADRRAPLGGSRGRSPQLHPVFPNKNAVGRQARPCEGHPAAPPSSLPAAAGAGPAGPGVDGHAQGAVERVPVCLSVCTRPRRSRLPVPEAECPPCVCALGQRQKPRPAAGRCPRAHSAGGRRDCRCTLSARAARPAAPPGAARVSSDGRSCPLCDREGTRRSRSNRAHSTSPGTRG